jgi:hypothetical protein
MGSDMKLVDGYAQPADYIRINELYILLTYKWTPPPPNAFHSTLLMSNMWRERKHSRTTQHYHFKFTISSYHCRGHAKETGDTVTSCPFYLRAASVPIIGPIFIRLLNYGFQLFPPSVIKQTTTCLLKENWNVVLIFFTLYNIRIHSK